MSKQDMNNHLTQNQKNAMSDDPKDGARNSETLGRDGPPTPLEKTPPNDAQDKDRIDALGWVGLVAGCAILLAVGYGGAWALGGALKLARGDRIAMTYAGAQKSVAMGAPLAIVLFPPAVAGLVLLPTLAYHLATLMVAAPIATRLRADAPT